MIIRGHLQTEDKDTVDKQPELKRTELIQQI